MAKTKYLLIIGFLITVQTLKAQVENIQTADSISTSLYNDGNWKQLITFGGEAIKKNIDFPGLRLKVAYAYFITGNFKQALTAYDAVLKSDPYNQTARLFSYYCDKSLNNDLGASYNAGYFDRETLNKEEVSSFGLIDGGMESGVKINNDINRDNGFYSRIGLSDRVTWRLQLEQSVAYFNQGIYKLLDNDGSGNHHEFEDKQKEYFSKLSLALNQYLAVLGSYHYLNTKFAHTLYDSNLGLLGLKYTGNMFDMQGDVDFGSMNGKGIRQYNAKLTYYPFGNFNLYTISRLSAKNSDEIYNYVFNQAIGFKVDKNMWLESAVTFGNQDDYLDADGLYVYNSIDNTTFKGGETVFYQIGEHAQLQLNYSYERKQDQYQSLTYDQNSITLGLLWKF